MVCGEKPSHQQTNGALDMHPHWTDGGLGAWPCLLLLPQWLREPPSRPSSLCPRSCRGSGFPLHREIETFSRNSLPPSRPHLAAPAPPLPLSAALSLQGRGRLCWPRSVFRVLCVRLPSSCCLLSLPSRLPSHQQHSRKHAQVCATFYQNTSTQLPF